ncbi:hypothetical protein N656DRAFT_183756 [Canariomyces notabilis]|uniref:YTH domain-containing protein n=1 Tax=Canariomyces notabilis TaxID=2074819 RepID=A0AAN6TAZ7_9PEZI|nr:hypothetical protein N656DRAFT_183756 [Canariomyces arenarius]
MPSETERSVKTIGSPTNRKRPPPENFERQRLKRPKIEYEENDVLLYYDSTLAALADDLGGLAMARTLDVLPDEILTSIFEYLIPQPVALGNGTSLCNRLVWEWTSYCIAKADLVRLCRVSRRIYTIARPLLYRNILITRPYGLCLLLCNLVRNPWLGRHIRHISSAISLEDPDTVSRCGRAWECLSTLFLDHLQLDGDIGQDHSFWKVRSWFKQHAANNVTDPLFPSMVLCAILCLANKIETLYLLLREPSPDFPRSVMWTWFLDDANSSVESHHSIPQGITTSTGYPPWEQLNETPCWPPPFLWKVVIEFGDYGGCNLVTCYMIRHIDSGIYMHQRDKFCVPGMEDTLTALNQGRYPRSSIVRLTAEEHSHFNGYLDSLMRLEFFRNLRLKRFIDALKAMAHTQAIPSRDLKAMAYTGTVHSRDLISSSQMTLRSLGEILSHMKRSWSPRLNVINKFLSIHVGDFLYRLLPLTEKPIHIDNLVSLTLYSEPPRSSDMSELVTDRWRRYDPMLSSPHRPLEFRLFALSQKAPKLRELHLPLCMGPDLTAFIYGPPGRLRWLDRLASLRTLTITMEGLFGKFARCAYIFDLLARQPPNAAGTASTKELEERMLRGLVEALPPSLARLNLIEWFGEYVNEEWTASQKSRIEKYHRIIVMGLWKLPRFVKEQRPALKMIEFRSKPWEDLNSDALLEYWATIGRRAIFYVIKAYERHGVKLAIRSDVWYCY